MALSTRSRIAVPVIGALISVGGLVGPAMAAPPSTSACPSEAVGMFMEHFNSKHLSQPLFGFAAAIADPEGWATGHGPLFVGMATKATTGSCSGNSGGGGYQP